MTDDAQHERESLNTTSQREGAVGDSATLLEPRAATPLRAIVAPAGEMRKNSAVCDRYS
jgi:hypothetical protein